MSGRSFVPKGQNSIIQELKVGEPFKVSLTLINNSGFLMTPSYLVLEPYQFSEELKRIVKDLRGKMIATCSFVNKVQEVNLYSSFTARWPCVLTQSSLSLSLSPFLTHPPFPPLFFPISFLFALSHFPFPLSSFYPPFHCYSLTLAGFMCTK